MHSEGVLSLMWLGCLDGVLGLLCLISSLIFLLRTGVWRYDERIFDQITKSMAMAMVMDIGKGDFSRRVRISACCFQVSLLRFLVFFLSFCVCLR